MMYRLTFFCLAALSLSHGTFAQTITAIPAKPAATFTISGSLKDTVNFMSVGYSSVALIRAADSMLQTFTRADEEGDFTLHTDAQGKYLLLISHPSFATLVDEVEVTKERTETGTLILTPREQVLDEVVITDAKAIVIKGDIMEYTADSFKSYQE